MWFFYRKKTTEERPWHAKLLQYDLTPAQFLEKITVVKGYDPPATGEIPTVVFFDLDDTLFPTGTWRSGRGSGPWVTQLVRYLTVELQMLRAFRLDVVVITNNSPAWLTRINKSLDNIFTEMQVPCYATDHAGQNTTAESDFEEKVLAFEAVLEARHPSGPVRLISIGDQKSDVRAALAMRSEDVDVRAVQLCDIELPPLHFIGQLRSVTEKTHLTLKSFEVQEKPRRWPEWLFGA